MSVRLRHTDVDPNLSSGVLGSRGRGIPLPIESDSAAGASRFSPNCSTQETSQ
jgi:hypothetical protein